ncbi:MAG: putative dehydrogenase/threonine dehydrogenase-like Zn-dependent dehydrogenase [Candidatus Krumholzibacteriia bacterium]
MKILAQTMKDGSVRIMETPAPLLAPGCVRVRTMYSAISPGTEGNKIVVGKMSLLGKAKAKPDQVKQVLGMVGQLGLKNTIQKVRDKLEGSQPLGYSLAGEVIEVGPGVEKVTVGDRVACAGGGYANHADEAVVPINLVVKIPDGVALDAASMTTLAAIALQGVRLSEPTLGENAVVIGLGAIGLMACQILKANGCRVFAADIAPDAIQRAQETGCADAAGQLGSDPVEAQISDFTRGRGADLVLICAATASSDPVNMAGRVSRQRGRVVVVGAVGMDLPRTDYYEKEIRFSVSCSYGPGRYDSNYEEGGLDYPYGFVRWTEGRNMEAVLDLMAAGTFDPIKLVTHRIEFDAAPAAYEMIATRSEPFCGIIVEYPEARPETVSEIVLKENSRVEGKIGIGFAGCGSFAQTFLLPPFRDDSRTTMGPIFTRTGLTAADVGKRSGFVSAVDTAESVINHEATDALVITTRHDQHGPLSLAGLKAGKHVFVEKPLCLTDEDLKSICHAVTDLAAAGSLPILQVGFNRRFSQASTKLKRHFGQNPGPLTMLYRVSAGHIARDHWSQDPVEGGGRILGEVCHFIDLMQFMCGADPVAVSAMKIETENHENKADDNAVINLRFADGSVGTIGYFSEGAKSMPKEQFEVLGAGLSGVIDNFQKVTLYSGRGKKKSKCSGKGHTEEVKAFIAGIASGQAPISADSQIATTSATLKILAALASGKTEHVPGRAELLNEGS